MFVKRKYEINEKAKEVHDQISEHPALGLDVEAYAAVDPNNIGKFYKGIEVVGTVNNIVEIKCPFPNKTTKMVLIIILKSIRRDIFSM